MFEIQHILELLEKSGPIASIISTVALFVITLQLLNERKGERHHAFFYLHEHLAHSDLSMARRRVRTALYTKDYNDWDESDKEAANRVCASYDQAGMLISKKLISPEGKEQFLKSSWGESICDQYEALQDFLNDWQTPWKRGGDFFVHFEYLYREARKHWRRNIRIVSGGQTGADRAALQVAKDLKLPYGGWVPKGGWAEDYPTAPGLLADYPNMREAGTPEPAERTRLNIRDSSATLILVTNSSASSPGTDLTRAEAAKRGRPLLVVNVDDPHASDEIAEWLRPMKLMHVLNVAGPRESEAPGLQAKACAVLRSTLKNYRAT